MVNYLEFQYFYQEKKIYSNREIIAELNDEIQQNVFHNPFPLYATQIINLFLNSRIPSDHVDGLSAIAGEMIIEGIDSLF